MAVKNAVRVSVVLAFVFALSVGFVLFNTGKVMAAEETAAPATAAAAPEKASGYEIDAVQVLRSSWVIALMFLLSIVVVGVAIERLLYFSRTKLNSEPFMEKIETLIDKGDYDAAIAYCDKSKGAVPIVVKAGIVNRKFEIDEVDKIMEATRMEQRLNQERYLDILGTLGNTAPFIGLLGTVLGIIKAFKDLAGNAGGGPEVVMVGIAEALIATAAGLGVAIPAVIIFNFFMKKVKTITVEMDAVAKKTLILLNNSEAGHGRKRG